MSVRRPFRTQHKREASLDIAVQLAEHEEELNVSLFNEAEFAEMEAEEIRREMIINGVDPDTTPLAKFSSLVEYNLALREVNFPDFVERETIRKVRYELHKQDLLNEEALAWDEAWNERF